jgi:hypothetical protein
MTVNQNFAGPGFIAAFFDIPFPISVPNNTYLVYDPQKEVAFIEVTLREGARAFFRNRAIQGPTSFEELRQAAQGWQHPREDHSYIATSVLQDGTEKATLNTHTGEDGGYVECKFYSEVCVTFLSDDISIIGGQNQGQVFNRVCEILNPFLDKYRLLNEDYRISHVSLERNFYLGTSHTSPLTPEEIRMSPRELFEQLIKVGRNFYRKQGHGASRILRMNSYELLGPRGQLQKDALSVFEAFIQERYETPLSYELIMEALRCLQKSQEYKLAIVHAETAFEVYVSDCLLKLIVDSGLPQAQAESLIENDSNYWGIKKRLRRLDHWTQDYCARNGLLFVVFVGTSLYAQWDSNLYQKRNRAVHAGAGAFSYDEASAAIGVAKECIVYLESRIPGMSDYVQLNPSMAGFRNNDGEVVF